MSIPSLRIARKGRSEEAKSRSFSAWLLGYMTADALWEGGSGGSPRRPVWLSYFGTEQEVRAVTANLRSGRTAQSGNLALELPKKAGYRWMPQAVAGGVVMTAYLPALFDLEPVSPFVDEVRFVLAPPRWWLDEQAAALSADFGADARVAARAALFAAYLARRTDRPLVPELRFQVRLYRAAIETGWVEPIATRSYSPRGFAFEDRAAGGLEEPLAVFPSPSELASFLTDQTTQYFEEERRHGTTDRTRGGRLLPDADRAVVQSSFDFAMAAGEG